MVTSIQEFTQAVEAKQIAQQGWFTVRDHESCDANDDRRCGAGKVHRGKGTQRVTKLVSAGGTESSYQAEQERQAAVIRAEGEAEAAATISRALEKAGEAFVALRKIEASKAIVQSLSRNGHVAYIPSSGGNVLLNVPSNKK